MPLFRPAYVAQPPFLMVRRDSHPCIKCRLDLSPSQGSSASLQQTLHVDCSIHKCKAPYDVYVVP